MAVLTLSFDKKQIKQYAVKTGDTLTIGRSDSNDIIIDNLAVSASHAKIDAMEQGFLLTDLKSKNGTFINGKMTNSHWLQDGDTITIGKHDLSLNASDEDLAPPEYNPLLDQTMVLDTDEHRFMKGKGEAAESERLGALSFIKGAQGEFILKKKLVKIGKGKGNDIVISGMTVGKNAITISRRPNGYYLSFVGGLSKPKVNGEPVGETVRLNEFDNIEIGSYSINFFYK